MDQLTAVFAVLGETYFKLRMTQDQLETAQEEKGILAQELEGLRKFVNEKTVDEEAAEEVEGVSDA